MRLPLRFWNLQSSWRSEGEFAELDRVRTLPGMTRALATALRRARNADVDFSAYAQSGAARLTEVARIEQAVRKRLPSSTTLPRDMRDLAIANAMRAPVVLGAVALEHMAWVAPVGVL